MWHIVVLIQFGYTASTVPKMVQNASSPLAFSSDDAHPRGRQEEAILSTLRMPLPTDLITPNSLHEISQVPETMAAELHLRDALKCAGDRRQ